MKVTIVVLLLIFLFTGCRRDSMISLEHYNQHKIIALQPLGVYDEQELIILGGQLSSFFKIQVNILDPIEIPHRFRDSLDDKYSADSLAKFLSGF